jgi:hypothetical protein
VAETAGGALDGALSIAFGGVPFAFTRSLVDEAVGA